MKNQFFIFLFITSACSAKKEYVSHSYMFWEVANMFYLERTTPGSTSPLDENSCECYTQTLLSICKPVSNTKMESIYNHPESRTDTCYNEGPVYLYTVHPDSIVLHRLKPVDSIAVNETEVRCIKKYIVDNGEYYEEYAFIEYRQRFYWTLISLYFTVNEDFGEPPHFHYHKLTYYFEPGHY